MHIAYNGWFWDQPNNGSGMYLRHLLHTLRRIAPDLDMTLIVPPHNRSLDNLPENVSVVNASGRGGKLGKVLFEQRAYPQLVRRVNADIAHVPYWAPPLSSPARLVTSILDVIPLVMPEYAGGVAGRLYTSLVAAAANGSAHTLTLSNAAKADIIQYLGLPEDRVTPTYLAADSAYHPRMGRERDAAVREKYRLPDEFVLCLGQFDRRKNINQLLLAYTYVAQAEGDVYPLVLTGREPAWRDPLFPNMRKYADQLEISDLVQWIGYVDPEDMPSLYRLATVFVFPSLYEGFGLPVVEAMACGTPVVANEISCLPEIVGDGAYLVEAGNAREMAGAILALLGQEALRDALINQGLARATHFNWRKTAQETLAVYEKVMEM
ncbi:MAG: glycosyltransferase family 4 protein [Anaerolineaceae bacterium]|nr:glycosyltransferase family 4 protein [Anaerolineaceae bacterium]